MMIEEFKSGGYRTVPESGNNNEEQGKHEEK